MTQALNLTINPHYSKTFRFFYGALIGLFLCGCYLVDNHEKFSTRWDNEVIIVVHFFTLGFLLPIFMGSITQLLPVLFGIADYKLHFFDKIIRISPIAIGAFLYYFHYYQIEKNYLLFLLLSLFWFYLLLFMVALFKKTLAKYREVKKIMYLHLIFCQIYFILGILASVWLISIHFGLPLPYFRPHVTNLHLILFILGFFYHLFVSISQHVIPMFFIAIPLKENILRRQLFMPVLLLGLFTTSPWPILYFVFKILITYLMSEYLLQIYWNLKNRRRKNHDPTIFLWNHFFFQVLLALGIWLTMTFVSSAEDWSMYLGGIIFIGVFLSLIMAMLVKIIPFLLWQNLSQLQMKTMNFQTSLPNLKDFIKDRDISIFFLLLIASSITILIKDYFILGMLLIILSVFLTFMIINSLKIHQNALILISESLTEEHKSFDSDSDR